MTDNAGGQVVAFERPAAYWLSKARAIKAPSRLPDAARMYAKALDKSGDPAVALELARVYLDMQCVSAAETTLLRAVARQGLTQRACLLIGRCAMQFGDESLGERALEMCMRLSPGTPDADEAQETLWSYPWTDESIPHYAARLRIMCLQGEEADNKIKADRRYRRAAKLANTLEKTVYLSQMLMATQFPVDISARLPREKLMHYALLSLRVQALSAAGQKQVAEQILSSASAGADTLSEMRALCHIAVCAGVAESMLALCERRLSQAPWSADMLRLYARCLLSCGDRERAAAMLDRAHALDQLPTDSTLASRDALEDALCAVPPRLRRGPLNRLLHFLTLTLVDDLPDETIYLIAAPAWRALTPAAKRRCEDDRDADWYTAFVVYTLSAAGKEARAAAVLENARGKRHIGRLVARLNRLRRPLKQIQ